MDGWFIYLSYHHGRKNIYWARHGELDHHEVILKASSNLMWTLRLHSRGRVPLHFHGQIKYPI